MIAVQLVKANATSKINSSLVNSLLLASDNENENVNLYKHEVVYSTSALLLYFCASLIMIHYNALDAEVKIFSPIKWGHIGQ